MNKKWMWPFVVLLGAALLSCDFGDAARADAPAYNMNEPFALGGGHEALIANENLRLRFTDVLEDSRCPTQVECFWTGQARIAVSVQPQGSAASTVEFNTNPAPGQTVKAADVDGYRIEFASLDPYPQTPLDPIPFEDYRATFVVRNR